MLRIAMAVALGAVVLAARCCGAASAHGQATIRSRDVLTSDWRAPPLATARASPTASASPSWNPQPTPGGSAWRSRTWKPACCSPTSSAACPPTTRGSKRGDIIVNVGGYQVGYVDGALFDLGDEMRRRVDPQGKRDVPGVRQPQPPAAQHAGDARAADRSGGVRGQVLCRERITLTPQAVLTVRLRDVTYPSWQNVEVGQQVIPNPPHPPIPFSIDFDPSTIYPDHKYAVDAWLVDRGQIVLQSATRDRR